MNIQQNVSLATYNTLRLDCSAAHFVVVTDLEELAEALEFAHSRQIPQLVLGGGSNVVLTADFPGLVIVIRLTGYEKTGCVVTLGAGENWHQTVRRLLEEGLSGLENLSLIPGSVGAAPIQNIGAYGVELRDRFHSLTAMDVETRERIVLDKEACRFGYRDSVFKSELKGRVVITSVTLEMDEVFEPVLVYKDLHHLHGRELTALEVSDVICDVRRVKLPDPTITGNVGSFFKNPVISESQLRSSKLLQDVPAQQDKSGHVKLSAAMLIDQCGLKGFKIGDAAVSEDHALVLINLGKATPEEVLSLASEIQHRVRDRFDLLLEIEPVLV